MIDINQAVALKRDCYCMPLQQTKLNAKKTISMVAGGWQKPTRVNVKVIAERSERRQQQ